MNRLTDFLASFCIALLLHGGLVLGAIWFWTVRPPELRPMFQSGDTSLAVTFIASADGSQTTDGGQQRTEKQEQTTDDRQRMADSGSRPPETTDIFADPETEAAEEESPTADNRQQTMDDEQRTEEAEDQEMLAAETVAPVSAQAFANTPAVGSQNAQQPPQSADALHQGVNGAVRMQSEIRPYYPLGARLRGEEGAVTVRVWVKPSGRATRCEVARSSGYPALDQAAVDAAQRARYVSTRPGIWHVEAETTLTFRFQLTE